MGWLDAIVVGAGWMEPTARYPANGGQMGVLGSYQRQQLFNINSTPVTTAGGNVATDQNMMSYAVPAGALLVVGRYMHIRGAGITQTQATGPTWSVKLQLGTLTSLLVFPTQTLLGSLTTAPWWFDAEIAVVTLASNGTAATLETHGTLTYRNSNTTTVASTVTQDSNVAVSAAINLQNAQTLLCTVAFPTNTSATNVCQQRKLVLETLDGTAT